MAPRIDPKALAGEPKAPPVETATETPPVETAATDTPPAETADTPPVEKTDEVVEGDAPAAPVVNETPVTKPAEDNPHHSILDPLPNAPPMTKTEHEQAAATLEKGGKAFIFNPSVRPLRDPFSGDRYPNGQTVRVKELSNWTIMQVQAGILRVGKAEDVGVPADENSDFVSQQEETRRKEKQS